MKRLQEIEALLNAAGERPSVPCGCNAGACGGARGPVRCPCVCHRASVALSHLRQRAPEDLALLARLVRMVADDRWTELLYDLKARAKKIMKLHAAWEAAPNRHQRSAESIATEVRDANQLLGIEELISVLESIRAELERAP